MRQSALDDLETEILLTRERLHHALSAIAAKLEPERVAQRAQAALSRRLARIASSKPAAAAWMALGLGILIGSRRGRAFARGKLIGAAGAAVWAAVLAAVWREPERRRLPAPSFGRA